MNSVEKKQMGLRIKQSREEKGYTQDELAEKLGMNRASIAGYEAGRAIPPSNVLRDIADIFNVSTDYLLGREKLNEFADQSTEDVIDIGWAIKEERMAQGLTQQELANQVGVTQKDISQYERDLTPIPSDILETIVRVFGMSFVAFLVKYNMYDEYIPSHFDGDVDKRLSFEKAVYDDVMRETGSHIKPNTDLPPLKAKDERDIARDLERMLNDLEANESLAFDGEPLEMDEETRELLRHSLESSMRLAKQIAKQKFTPKKYRK